MPNEQELKMDGLKIVQESIHPRNTSYSNNRIIKAKLEAKERRKKLHKAAIRLFVAGCITVGITHGVSKIIDNINEREAREEFMTDFYDDIFEPGKDFRRNITTVENEYSYNYGTIASALNKVDADEKRAVIFQLYKEFDSKDNKNYEPELSASQKMDQVFAHHLYEGSHEKFNDYVKRLGYESLDDYKDNEGIIVEALIAAKAAELNYKEKRSELNELLNKPTEINSGIKKI